MPMATVMPSWADPRNASCGEKRRFRSAEGRWAARGWSTSDDALVPHGRGWAAEFNWRQQETLPTDGAARADQAHDDKNDRATAASTKRAIKA